MKAIIAAMLGLMTSPFQRTVIIPARKSHHRYKMAKPKPVNNPAGSKALRKAAEKRLTGNRMSHYGQGLLNQFARTRGARA